VTFDAANKATQPALESVLQGPYQSLGPNDISALFLNAGQALVNGNPQSGGGGPGTTITLTTTAGYAKGSRYGTIDSLGTATAVKDYRIQTPSTSNNESLVLTVSLQALAPGTAAPRVTILDSSGNAVPAQILANDGGTFTIQATNVRGGGDYDLRVAADGSPSAVGNYALTASFGTAAANLSTFASGSLAPAAASDTYNFYVGESQLFQFLLSAGQASSSGAIAMTVMDHNGNVVYSLTAAAGDTISGNAVFLTPGSYTLEFARMGTSTGLDYRLFGEAISDPIGPCITDPTTTPVFQSPTMPQVFVYPNGVVTTIPYWIAFWATAPLPTPPPPPPPTSTSPAT
jgi:hypothetical protein